MYHSFFICKMSACHAEHCKGVEGWTVEREGERDHCALISWVSARCQLLWGISITTTCREGGGIVLTYRWGDITMFYLRLSGFTVMVIWGCDCQDSFVMFEAHWWISGKKTNKQTKKTHLPIQETHIWSLGQEDPWEKEMAAHCSILAWEIPWTEEPGRLRSMGSESRTWLSN